MTDHKKSEPREFWIQRGEEDIIMDRLEDWVPGWNRDKAIHVIEYSAYEQLREQLDEADYGAQALELAEERDKLREQLREAHEIVKKLVNNTHSTIEARKYLEKYGEGK